LAQAAAITLGEDARSRGDSQKRSLAAIPESQVQFIAAAGRWLGRVLVLTCLMRAFCLHPQPLLLTADLDADFGVMISASHNPAPDNGIKFCSRRP
jgi:phosphoglucosamine mutase